MNINGTGQCNDIAIVGLACRFPGAENYNYFWRNLEQGISSIREIDRWNFAEYYSPNRESKKSISKWCGLLDNIDMFDNNFFAISPREANHMDPQQRILLEETWHCIEDSGIALRTLQTKRTSVYVGAMALDSYLKDPDPGAIDLYSASGIYQFMMANRVSYYLGLSGESIVLEAACASSMVALCNAKKALAVGDDDYALVAGVNLHFSPMRYLMWSKNKMLSADGKCKTFDKDADGFVSGEGVGVLLLQPLDKAVQEKNHIYGVIKGAAVNHGGKAISISAPRVEAQKDVILAAYEDAGFSPDTVTYVEAHGTGTSLGDPIEIEALTKAFEGSTTEKQFCRIGSVKTNVGHLEAAAGMPGIIKVLLMMRYNKIPPTLNVQKINPIIDFADSPFIVADHLTAWTSRKAGEPLRAGVSSFGFGGVNCHILLEKYSEIVAQVENDGGWYPFVLSAKSTHSLENSWREWREFSETDSFAQLNFSDICLTMLQGRMDFPYRCGALLNNKAALRGFLKNDVVPRNTNIDASWCLCIGELSWNKIDLKAVSDEMPLFKEKLDQVFAFVEEYDPDHKIKESLLQSNGSTSFANLNSFIVTYAVVATIMELGISFNRVTGLKKGVWISLVISGAVELKEMLAVLCGKRDLAQVHITRPSIPFYDPLSQKVVEPYILDETYICSLLEGLHVSDEIVLHYLEKTRLLFTNQFTFVKYLEEWDSKLEPFGLNVRKMLIAKDFLTISDKRLEKRKLLAMIIMMSSLYRLNQKWNLSKKSLAVDKRFYEVLDLVLDEAMTKEDVIALLMNDQPDLTIIARNLRGRQNRLNAKKMYPCLQKYSKENSVLSDILSWNSNMQAVEDLPLLPGLEYLNFGIRESSVISRGLTFDSDVDFSVAFKTLVVELWNRGGSIQWDKLYPENSFRKCPLPVYCFQRSSFWLPGKIGGNKVEGLKTFGLYRPGIFLGRPYRKGAAGFTRGSLS